MIRYLLGATAFWSLLVSPAAAMITYDVVIPTLQGGGDSANVAGTITTDGTLGEINESSITDWSLSFTGTSGLNLTMNATDSAFGEAYIFGWGLIATADALTLSTDPTTYLQVGYEDPTFATEVYFLFSSGQFSLTVRNDEMDLWTFADGVERPGSPGQVQLGEIPASAVPLPAAAGLLGAGLVGLGLFARRRPFPV